MEERLQGAGFRQDPALEEIKQAIGGHHIDRAVHGLLQSPGEIEQGASRPDLTGSDID